MQLAKMFDSDPSWSGDSDFDDGVGNNQDSQAALGNGTEHVYRTVKSFPFPIPALKRRRRKNRITRQRARAVGVREAHFQNTPNSPDHPMTKQVIL